jgi:hypothetical protein
MYPGEAKTRVLDFKLPVPTVDASGMMKWNYSSMLTVINFILKIVMKLGSSLSEAAN